MDRYRRRHNRNHYHLSSSQLKTKILPLFLFCAVASFANDTCIEFCGSCMGKSDSPACAKVELLCKCSEMISNLKDEISEASSDTAAIDSIPADTVSVDTVSYDTAQTADSTTDTTVVDTTALPATDSLAQDTVAKDSVIKDTAKQEAARDTSLAIIEPTTPQHVELNPEKKERIFYKGVSIGFEQFQEETVANYDVERADEIQDHFGINLGFLLRWYFYSHGSFQTGLNAVWHHGYYYLEDDHFYASWAAYYYSQNISVEYHNLMAEIPLTVRFGLPFKFSPYLSLSVHIRKPIYAWVDYDAYFSWGIRGVYDYDSYSYDSQYYNYDDYNSADGTFSIADWEFLGYVGAGLEITRHVSLQWQMVVVNAVTYSNEILNYRIAETWRIGLDFAW